MIWRYEGPGEKTVDPSKFMSTESKHKPVALFQYLRTSHIPLMEHNIELLRLARPGYASLRSSRSIVLSGQFEWGLGNQRFYLIVLIQVGEN